MKLNEFKNDQKKRSVKNRIFGVKIEGKSLTRQEFKDECDIGIIVERYMDTGQISHLNQRIEQYVDNNDKPDFQESMNYITEAKSLFEEYPADIRKFFENDPAKFIDFCSNPENAEQMVELGLAEALPEEDNSPVRVVIENEGVPPSEE